MAGGTGKKTAEGEVQMGGVGGSSSAQPPPRATLLTPPGLPRPFLWEVGRPEVCAGGGVAPPRRQRCPNLPLWGAKGRPDVRVRYSTGWGGGAPHRRRYRRPLEALAWRTRPAAAIGYGARVSGALPIRPAACQAADSASHGDGGLCRRPAAGGGRWSSLGAVVALGGGRGSRGRALAAASAARDSLRPPLRPGTATATAGGSRRPHPPRGMAPTVAVTWRGTRALRLAARRGQGQRTARAAEVSSSGDGSGRVRAACSGHWISGSLCSREYTRGPFFPLPTRSFQPSPRTPFGLGVWAAVNSELDRPACRPRSRPSRRGGGWCGQYSRSGDGHQRR